MIETDPPRVAPPEPVVHLPDHPNCEEVERFFRHVVAMGPRCILCNVSMTLNEESVATQEDPDLVCAMCRALPADDRRMLRDAAVERMQSKAE